jgi:hypothetical protein
LKSSEYDALHGEDPTELCGGVRLVGGLTHKNPPWNGAPFALDP